MLVNAFVGGMVGMERTVGTADRFRRVRITSTTLVASFIVSFGVIKALPISSPGSSPMPWAGSVSSFLGWLVGLPVPFMIIWAPSWGWIVAANALLGINQGLAWSMTVIMKVDLVGPKSRGLAVGSTSLPATSPWASRHFSPVISPLDTVFDRADLSRYQLCGLGALLSIMLVRDTREHVRLEAAASSQRINPMSFRQIFLLTSFRDRNLFAASQAGLVNNLNDGMSWGIFPLFFASFGLGVERIGILKAVYPATWGILQVATGRSAIAGVAKT